MNVLYISYDGMMEPLGRSQVLQYLKKLAPKHAIMLISYEKKSDWSDRPRRNALMDEIRGAGILWYPLRYHKRPSALATAYDICVGFLLAGWLAWRRKVEIVHARSYVPSVLALRLKAVFGIKFIFDMRGFWADEKVDGGQWARDGILYRTAKQFERRLLLSADRVVSLTHAAVNEIRAFSYLQGRMPILDVITTCADLELFHPQRRAANPDKDGATAFTLGYVGAVTFSYLFDEALASFKLLRELVPSATFLILNRGERDFIRSRLVFHGIEEGLVELRAVDYSDLPQQISRMDACVFFIRPVYSKVASAPTKLGELLGCGVPCLSNAGVGDMTGILERERTGVVVKDFGKDSMKEAIRQLLVLARDPEIQHRCRQAAERHFSLEDGVRAYARIYEELGSHASGR